MSPDQSIRRVETPDREPVPSGRRHVLGISGASGADYALRTLEQLLVRGHEVHLVISDYGRRLLKDETGVSGLSLADLAPHLADCPHARALAGLLVVHPHRDVGAVIASGSFLHDGMAVVPCSSTSLGQIATASGSNLLCRAAMVTLKERRPLVIVHRESPLNLVDIENMRTLTLAGATICPANPGFYLGPRTVADIVDFTVGKVLDLLGVEHDLDVRWKSPSQRPPGGPDREGLTGRA